MALAEVAVVQFVSPQFGEAVPAFSRVLLRVRHELRIPMLWIEHDMQLVVALATRVAVLNFGELIAVGTPREVLRDPHVARAYLGDGYGLGVGVL